MVTLVAAFGVAQGMRWAFIAALVCRVLATFSSVLGALNHPAVLLGVGHGQLRVQDRLGEHAPPVLDLTEEAQRLRHPHGRGSSRSACRRGGFHAGFSNLADRIERMTRRGSATNASVAAAP